jgi:UDPglucose 6-dehydrogenase
MIIGFIGLGKLGLPVAETMAKNSNHTVVGYDVTSILSNHVAIQTSVESVVTMSDIVFIAVPTPHNKDYDGSVPSSHLEPMDFNYDSVIDVLTKINTTGKSIPVVLISTVLPGTVRKQLAPILKLANLIYNPYLIAMGTVAEDFLNPEMIMIGNDSGMQDENVILLRDLYLEIIKKESRIVCGTWEEMECTKIFYNTIISAKLGIVNMIQDVAERIGHTNVDIVADALARSTKRITSAAYMKPGIGDGGPCHPRDNIALRWLSSELNLGYDLFDAIMRAREVQAENLAKELLRHNLPIYILGKSFKPNVPYTDGSYSVLVGHYCLPNPVTYDTISKEPAVYLLAHDKDYSLDILRMCKNSVVIDPWRRTRSQEHVKIIHYGNSRLPK